MPIISSPVIPRPVSVANGGTGAATLTLNGVLYGNGTSAIQATAQGGTRTILTANAGAPAWSAAAIINNSFQIGVASSTTGDLILAHALSANLTTIRAGNATAAVTYVWPTADGSADQRLTTNGAGVLSWATVAGGGAALSGITAATASNTIASGNNVNQIWNWAVTSNSVDAFEFGETTAATGGTSTAGVPNQVLLKIGTLAASTMSPLSVYSRASHVFSVSPDTVQIFAGSGSASDPIYSFAAATATGMSLVASDIVLSRGGTQQLTISNNAVLDNTGNGSFQLKTNSDGTALLPTYTYVGDTNTGMYRSGADILGFSVAGVENALISAGTLQISKGTADAVSYVINSRKARGTVAAPTVITTGDDLLMVSGYGYVGATNTFVEAARILMDSTGTISDTATGIGSIISFLTRASGGSLTERARVNEDGGIQLISVAAPAAVNGNLWQDSTQNTLIGRTSGINQSLSGTVFTATGSATVANSTAEATLVGSGVGTATLPASFFAAGKTVRITASGIFSSDVINTDITIRVRLGGITGTVVLTTGVNPIQTSATNRGWQVTGLVTCRTTGATGTVFSQGYFNQSTSATQIELWDMENSATTTIDTTVSQLVVVSAQWATAAAANTITCTNLVLEVLN